jgi:hypothetical protein
MKLNWSIFAFCLFIFAQPLWAGGHGDYSGNGGTVMICPDHIVSYDIYEGKVLRHLTPQMGPANLSYEQKVETVLSRIPESNAGLREILQDFYREFQKRSVFGDFDLIPVNDGGQLVIEPGCEIHQAAVQKSPATDKDARYFLDQKIWSRLDNDSKAALVLHEIVYRMTISQGQTTSTGARSLNSYLMDPRVLANEPCLYISLLENLQLSTLDFIRIGNLTVVDSLSKITPTCAIQEAVVADGFLKVLGQIIYPATSASAANQPAVVYSEDGYLQRLLIGHEQILTVKGVTYHLALNDQGLGELTFDDQGRLQRALVKDIDTVIQGQHIQMKAGVLIFDSVGTPIGVSNVNHGFGTVIDGITFKDVRQVDQFQGQLRLWAPEEILLQTNEGPLKMAGLFLFQRNELLETSLTEPTALKVGCLAAPTNIHFYPGHKIRQFVAAQACRLPTSQGASREVQANEIVILDEAGNAQGKSNHFGMLKDR